MIVGILMSANFLFPLVSHIYFHTPYLRMASLQTWTDLHT